MAKGFVNISHSSNGSVDYYCRHGEFIGFRHSDKNLKDLEVVKQIWKQLEQNEKLGNKELGIRGRHDARVRTNYVLSLPNELTPKEAANKIQEIIDNCEIKNCTYTMFLHKGEKDGIKNLHMHLLVNERDLNTGKKDRVMQRKEWLEKTFRPLYAKVFEGELKKAPNKPRRERISMELYQSDVQGAKDIIQAVYDAKKEEIFPTKEEVLKMTWVEQCAWRLFEMRKMQAARKGEKFGGWENFKAEYVEARKQEEQQQKERQKRPGIRR